MQGKERSRRKNIHKGIGGMKERNTDELAKNVVKWVKEVLGDVTADGGWKGKQGCIIEEL